jgi:hypothetical protein
LVRVEFPSFDAELGAALFPLWCCRQLGQECLLFRRHLQMLLKAFSFASFIDLGLMRLRPANSLKK